MVTADLFVCPVCGDVRRPLDGQARMSCVAATRHAPPVTRPNTSGGTTKITHDGQSTPMVLVRASWETP